VGWTPQIEGHEVSELHRWGREVSELHRWSREVRMVARMVVSVVVSVRGMPMPGQVQVVEGAQVVRVRVEGAQAQVVRVIARMVVAVRVALM
jgi:hypothetical protein